MTLLTKGVNCTNAPPTPHVGGALLLNIRCTGVFLHYIIVTASGVVRTLRVACRALKPISHMLCELERCGAISWNGLCCVFMYTCGRKEGNI